MIRFSVNEDREKLIKLWCDVFGDTSEAVKIFFEYHYKPENTLVYDVNKNVVAMLYLLEGNFVISGERYPSYYLYAAATDAKYRGKGIMGKLLDFAKETAASRGKDYICLLPAEESLYGYYYKHGYKSVFKKKIVKIKCINKEHEIRSACLNLKEFRNKFFDTYDYFEWDENAIEYAIKQNEYYGGGFVFECNGYCLYAQSKGIVTVKETTLLPENLSLLDTNIVVNLPADYPLNGENCEIIENGMALPLNLRANLCLNNVKNAYLGLTLD